MGTGVSCGSDSKTDGHKGGQSPGAPTAMPPDDKKVETDTKSTTKISKDDDPKASPISPPRVQPRPGEDDDDGIAEDGTPSSDEKPTAGPSETEEAELVSRMAYSTPEEMTLGEESLVEARITADPDEPLHEGFPGDHPTGEKELPYRPGISMCVELVGAGFEIEPQPTGTEPCARKTIPESGHVDWSWNVTPEDSGRLELIYKVHIFGDGGEASTRAAHREKREVRVRVTVRHWIDDNLVWLAGVITALLGAALVIRKVVIIVAKRRAGDEDGEAGDEDEGGDGGDDD